MPHWQLPWATDYGAFFVRRAMVPPGRPKCNHRSAKKKVLAAKKILAKR